jgi:peptidoglycan/xylan/chitin deacetylase (PgdA/CDA1 family)
MPPRITLTFDNGPVPGITDRVLDILALAGLSSTFFVIGRKLDDPAAVSLMKEAHAAGHWIGNHTLTHSVAFGDRPDADYAAQEIGRTQDLIGDLAHADKLFRPYGKAGLTGPHLFSKAAIAYLLANRFRTIIWNSVPGDWRDAGGWVESCLSQISAQDWSVVVLHDIDGACLPRLPELLQRLNDLGATYEQDFPDNVTLTRAGEALDIPGGLIGG